MSKRYTENAEAYQLYLRGHHARIRRPDESWPFSSAEVLSVYKIDHSLVPRAPRSSHKLIMSRAPSLQKT